MKQTSTFHLIILFLGGLVLLFILAPLTNLFFSSSIQELIETTQDSKVQSSIWLTLSTAFIATFIFGLMVIPLAYILARKNFPGKKIVMGIMDLPVVIPHTAAGIAILGVISRESTIGKTVGFFGFDLIGSPLGISIAMAFVSVPFLLNAARDGFIATPVRLEKAALNLGASPARVFLTISIPLAWRSILSGAIMMFARGMSEFGAVVIIAYHPMVAPVMIYERLGAFGLKYAQPVAVIFVLVSLTFFILLRMLAARKTDY